MKADPVGSILNHMSKVLYDLKKGGLVGVFSKAMTDGNVHHQSGFWEHVQVRFGTLPVAEKFPLSLSKVRDLFQKEVTAGAVVEALSPHIPIEGGDTNPYINFLSNFCRVEGFNMFEFYECDEDFVPKDLKTGTVAVIFQQVAVLW